MGQYFSSEDLAENRIFLVLSAATALRENNARIVTEMTEQRYGVIVITTSYPCAVLRGVYTKHGIDLEQISFIDTITAFALGSTPAPDPRCRYVNNPSNLTDIGIAVSELLKQHTDQKTCILIDSVSTMLIYLSSVNISKFIHFVSNKLRLMDVAGIFLAVEKGLDPLLMTQLTTFADSTIEMLDP